LNCSVKSIVLFFRVNWHLKTAQAIPCLLVGAKARYKYCCLILCIIANMVLNIGNSKYNLLKTDKMKKLKPIDLSFLNESLKLDI